MPFLKENLVAGLGSTRTTQFEAGTTDIDVNKVLEQGVMLPWPSDPEASWVYYDCTVGVMLDSGIAVHNRLPQVDRLPDTLSMCDLDDPRLDKVVGDGVNLRSRDQYADIVQRMGHSRYWFRLWGQALRIGHKVPIPSIKYIGGVQTVPYDKNPQWAFNRIMPGANYCGAILWHAAWSLWYTTSVPPRTQEIPCADPSAHIGGKVAPPPDSGIQAPYSQPDGNTVNVSPPSRGGRR